MKYEQSLEEKELNESFRRAWKKTLNGDKIKFEEPPFNIKDCFVQKIISYEPQQQRVWVKSKKGKVYSVTTADRVVEDDISVGGDALIKIINGKWIMIGIDKVEYHEDEFKGLEDLIGGY